MNIRKNFGLDSTLTIAAIGILAYIFTDLIHEVIGHGVVCLINDGNIKLLTSVYFQSDLNNILVNIGGPAANLLAGVFLYVLTLIRKNFSIHTKLFLILAIGFNLFWAAGGLIYSGITNSDDWSYAIAGMEPSWLWRSILVSIGLILYFISIKIVSQKISELTLGEPERAKKIILIPYLAAGIAACIAAGFYLPNPVSAIKEAALETFVASIGFLIIWRKLSRKKNKGFTSYAPVTRNLSLVFVVLIIFSIFILSLGRGLSF